MHTNPVQIPCGQSAHARAHLNGAHLLYVSVHAPQHGLFKTISVLSGNATPSNVPCLQNHSHVILAETLYR